MLSRTRFGPRALSLTPLISTDPEPHVNSWQQYFVSSVTILSPAYKCFNIEKTKTLFFYLGFWRSCVPFLAHHGAFSFWIMFAGERECSARHWALSLFNFFLARLCRRGRYVCHRFALEQRFLNSFSIPQSSARGEAHKRTHADTHWAV